MSNIEKNSILVVDHDGAWTNWLAMGLHRAGLAVDTATNGQAAIELARRTEYGVTLMDWSLPGLSGMETVRRIKEFAPETKFIIVTSQPTQESLVEAIHEHLFDYLCKPVDLKTVRRSIQRALDEPQGSAPPSTMPSVQACAGRSLAWTPKGAEDAGRRALDCPMLVGESETIQQVRQQIMEVTPTGMTVLIRGESGTGKGVVARMIHELSGRGAKGVLVTINCPAIPETLLESELFGHESGAFTGAEGRKPGRFELAHGGTIFLDEIGEIPPQIQVKLLQVIERKELQRIGGSHALRVDARILAATNASLEQMIGAGRFRADLFYRLNEYSIHLPPLRRRVEDIPLLVQHFLELYGREFSHEDLAISPEVMSLLLRFPWLGNVRELESVIRRFALTGREDSIRTLLKFASPDKPVVVGRETLRQNEIQTLMTALVESRWNQRRAASRLGISYSALRRRIEKYGLKLAGGGAMASPLSVSPDCQV